MKVASFDLQLAYPQLHNRGIREVHAMDGAGTQADRSER